MGINQTNTGYIINVALESTISKFQSKVMHLNLYFRAREWLSG